MRGSVAYAPSLLYSLAISAFLASFPVSREGVRAAGTQEKRPVYTASSRLVLLDVLVQERSTGQPVSGLHQDDFEIRDEGELRDISHFDTELFRLDVIFVLDLTSRVSARAECRQARALIGLSTTPWWRRHGVWVNWTAWAWSACPRTA